LEIGRSVQGRSDALRDGTFEANFSDSYKFEFAAYELDKLLGLGLVPPSKLVAERGEGAVLFP